MAAESKIKNLIIGQGLQLRRENVSLTRSELAQKLQVKPQFVANWERGQCLPPKKVMGKLVNVLNMSKKEIVNLYTKASKIALEEYFNNLDES